MFTSADVSSASASASACAPLDGGETVPVTKVGRNVAGVGTPDGCRYACDAEPGCNFFLYKPRRRLCILLAAGAADGCAASDCDGDTCQVVAVLTLKSWFAQGENSDQKPL